MKTQTQAPVVAHTPTPWESAGCGIYQPDLWRDGINHGGRFVASTFDSELHPDCPSDTDLVNAAFICLAVNSHAALVDALQGLLAATVANYLPGIPELEDAQHNAALALAHGKKEV